MSLALCVIFFLSGASALLFETLWFRLAGLTFGNSLWASSLVLAAFMGGLGLGNLLALRYGPRLKKPLVVYAMLEVVIGLVGFLLVLVFPLLTPALVPIFRPFLDSPVVLQFLRLVIAFALLLIPATAMGMTLPLLVKTLSVRDENFGRVLGRLYGFNTLGAVAGALSGELLFIGMLGLRGTGLVAALLNIVAAAASLALARVIVSKDETPDSTSVKLTPAVLSLLGAALLSGALLLGLEVVWFRFLQLFVLGSSLIFSVMLAVVLLGIALGGLFASVWLGRRPGDYRHARLVALAASMLTVFTYILFDDGFGFYGPSPVKPVPDAPTAFYITLGLCGPVSFLSGILFTFLGRALGEELGNDTKATAVLTLANTTGAMLGSLAAGFVLIPTVGVEWAIFLMGAAYLGVAFASGGAGVSEKARAPEEILALRIVVGAAFLLFLFFPFGLMRNHYIPMATRLHRLDGSKIVAMREGPTETAIYLRSDLWELPRQFRLITNGFSMSGSGPRSERYMKLFAYWPAALHPEPKSALLISYGVGITAKALTEIEVLESIDIVDISKTVLDLNREVGMFAEHPLDDARVRVHIEDGRFFLQATGERYDIITAEPPPPKNAGIVNLYTREYFQLLHDRLSEGGLATYWLPVYQMTLGEAKAISKAFCAAFTDCSLWTGAGTEWMLAGSRGGMQPISDEQFGRLWKYPPSRDGLVAIGVENREQLGALFLGDASFLQEWVGDVDMLEDNYPHRISSRVTHYTEGSPTIQEYLRVMNPRGSAERFYASTWIEEHWPRGYRERTRDYFRYQDALNRHFMSLPTTLVDLDTTLVESSLSALPLFLLNASARDASLAEQAAKAGTIDPNVDYFRAARAISERRYDEAVAHLDRAVRLDSAAIELQQYRIFASMLAGDEDAARQAGEDLRLRVPAGSGLAGFWEWFGGRESVD
ncbi:MAG: spermidine synthase [Acidobacteria bacterium]|nr:MAG: spermidine synthase [Acidobacteriota bacterium]